MVVTDLLIEDNYLQKLKINEQGAKRIVTNNKIKFYRKKQLFLLPIPILFISNIQSLVKHLPTTSLIS